MKDIIEKALRRSQDLPIEDQAEMVARYLDIAQDIAGAVPQTFMGLSVKTDAAMPKGQMKIVTPAQSATAEFEEPPVLPSRLGAPVEVNKQQREYRSVDEIASYLEANAPPRLGVSIEGAPAPMEVVRRVEAHEPMKMVKLVYIPPGGIDGPCAVFCTTDEKLGLADKLQEIRDAIRAQYSAVPRVVKSKPARVTPEGVNMVGGEASDHEGLSGFKWSEKDMAERKQFK